VKSQESWNKDKNKQQGTKNNNTVIFKVTFSHCQQKLMLSHITYYWH